MKVIISNCVLSNIGATLIIVGFFTFNEKLQYFGWGMILVSTVNAIGWIIGKEKENRKKDEL
ncbi:MULTISPECIES: hypothetical protein [unclassified Enterococcus]|uniref:hypothetical protein n=1 Tax=unclassified Enterococcus TaxID=2608891 RepID=UPI001CE0E6CE|nr:MULTISPECIES: hypothetical protein [unclassified Enterococcus]MCA5014547.1 hypothetical protein [Enterococcus sp. S23]MCA5017800.1 hypothetical protein [Enterococcus sp. S22(2020)]